MTDGFSPSLIVQVHTASMLIDVLTQPDGQVIIEIRAQEDEGCHPPGLLAFTGLQAGTSLTF